MEASSKAVFVSVGTYIPLIFQCSDVREDGKLSPALISWPVNREQWLHRS